MASNTPRRVAIYARVSTDDQTVENQLIELRLVAERHSWDVVQEFIDSGISGAKGRDKRPAFDDLCQAVTRREIDLIAVWSVDRLGRSLRNLVSFLDDVHAKSVDLYLHQQGIDTTTPGGKAMFQMLGVFAEFERAMIVERVRAGMARARAKGKHLGRPRIAAKLERKIVEVRATGKGIKKTAQLVGVAPATVRRVLAERA